MIVDEDEEECRNVKDLGPGVEVAKLVNNWNRYSIVKFILKGTVNKIATSEYFVRSEKTFRSSKLVLRDLWARTTQLSQGTIINITGTSPDENDELIVERDQGFMIVDPDRLISVTSVVGMYWCERKIAFSEKFRFPVDNVDTLRGTIAHDLICQSMKKKLHYVEAIEAELKMIISHPNVIEKACGLCMSQEQLEKLGHELVLWVLSFVAQRMIKKRPKQTWKIDSVKDIEDCYWSPEFGLKGKIDCTVLARRADGQNTVIPLEFKTGNPKFAGNTTAPKTDHLGQVYLYTLLMRSASEIPENNGLLYYIREDNFVECTASMRDLQSLVMCRNGLVLNMAKGTNEDFRNLPLPSGVDYDRNCKRCEYRNICAVSLKGQLKNSKNDLPKSGSTEEKLLTSISYLEKKEIDFFEKWIQVINLEAEEDENHYTTKDLWMKSVSQRESEGKCIGGLRISHQNQDPGSDASVTFEIPESKRHLAAIILEKDFIILGAYGDPCISFAYVEKVTPTTITLSLERLITGRHSTPEKTFTIDKVRSNSAGMMQFVYLCRFMEDSPASKRWRRRLIFGEKPEFRKMRPTEITQHDHDILVKYNKPQREAIIKAMTTDSILLVKGSPGCGKTSTIVGLVRMLVSRKKRVLVSAYTSNALDNILLNYKKFDNNFLRIGSGGKLNEELLFVNSTNALRSKITTVDEFASALNSTAVVGTTLLSLKHPIFKICKFDFCIIDEGSQALPTVIMGALLQADKCIVFGDPNQLPSVIKSRKIKAMNIDDNIFGMVSAPEFYCNLVIQYRMNQFIMKISNQLLYDNRMQCASKEQAQYYLKIPGKAAMKYLAKHFPLERTQRWVGLAVSVRLERSLLFLDTECIGAFEKCVANTLSNIREKDIVLSITRMLLECGIPPVDVGIIAPYRGQVLLIRERLQAENLQIEVNTVDQYQGREKEVIILSFTKSVSYVDEEDKTMESILNDVRRLNVAITRAKRKVILIGNQNTLKSYPACKKLFSLLQPPQQYKLSSEDFSSTFFAE